MADNKSKTDARDRSKVDANDFSEVEYLHQQFPNLEHKQVLDAVKKYGPDREKITRFLEGQK